MSAKSSTLNRFSLLLLAATLASFVAIQDLYADSVPEAIEGYDTVAYFALKKATLGNRKHHHDWNGKRWYFTSEKHRDLFAVNPKKYAPQYNGLCANGLADGHKIDADPENWRIIDGKLYLYFSEYGRDQWKGDVKPLIESAEKLFQNK